MKSKILEDEIKKRASTVYQRFNLFINQYCHIVRGVEKIKKVKTQKLQRQIKE